MSAQRLAALWHWADAGILGLAFFFALLGLAGHYRLRARYEAERA